MRRSRLLATAACALLLLAGCGSSQPARTATSPPKLTLYTSVTQNTVDAVVAGFTAAHPGATVDVFRATTGQLNARIAADERSGGVRADVIWGTDPLSMQSYADQGLLSKWPAPDVTGVPEQFKTAYFWGTRVLYVIMVAHTGLRPTPQAWADLTNPVYRGKVAIPDPATAGSAFAALGYLSQAPGFGLDFYRTLKSNGATQVSTVPEVVTDVAQGRYQLGVTLDSEIRAAVKNGSPVTAIWPREGAIALYSPIAQTAASKKTAAAEAWLRYVLSPEGQRKIAATGWQPVLPNVAGPPKPPGATSVSPEWGMLFGKQQELLRQYQSVFGS
jgi:iron(III) transport system substrate-binding protein